MSESQHRASLHLTFERDADNRPKLFNEAFRNIIDGASESWAQKNNHIVLADEALTENYVNDGSGELVPCDDVQEIFDYGASRIAKLSRKPRKPKKTIDENGDIKTDGKGTVTTLSFVAHLPKYLCEEIPDFYEDVVEKKDEETGEVTTSIVKYSRWVAKDRNVARDYFEDVVDYMAENVLPGGVDSILGVSIQHSETTPHIHILADPFGEHPDKPGKLRADYARAFGAHEAVKNEDGKMWQSTGHDGKMAHYQFGLRQYLLSKDWQIDLEPDPERKGQKSASKSEYEKAQSLKRKAESEMKEAKRIKADAERDIASAEAQEAYAIDMALEAYNEKLEREAERAEDALYEHELNIERAELQQKNVEVTALTERLRKGCEEIESMAAKMSEKTKNNARRYTNAIKAEVGLPADVWHGEEKEDRWSLQLD